MTEEPLTSGQHNFSLYVNTSASFQTCKLSIIIEDAGKYIPMTKSNLNNILRGVAPIPPYIQNIYNEEYEEYIKPFFEEIYPNKKDITNKRLEKKDSFIL